MTSTNGCRLYAVALLIGWCGICEAQSRYRPPAGSPLPRQLDYFRADVGVLDPYNTFVAPRKRLDQNLRQLASQQYADEQRTQQSLSMIRQAGVAPTGTGATFMNYSHYYGMGGGSGMNGGMIGSVRTARTRTTPARPSSSAGGIASSMTSTYGAQSFSVDSYKPASFKPGDYGTGSLGVRNAGARRVGIGVYGQ